MLSYIYGVIVLLLLLLFPAAAASGMYLTASAMIAGVWVFARLSMWEDGKSR